MVLRGLLLPPGGLLLIGVAGLLVWRRRQRLGIALCAICIAGLWLLSMPLVGENLARAAEGYPALDPAHLTPAQLQAQAIVVLGGGFRRNAPEVGADAPSGAADLRLIEGARVARATHLPVLLTGSAEEVIAMKRFMEESLGVPVRWVEEQSRTTRENAQFSARMLRPLGIDRIILVTTGTHMTRAVGDFAAAGFSVTAAPAGMITRDEGGVLGFVPSPQALSRSYEALYEWAGRLVHHFI